jgi:hypothetical protein
MKGLEKEKDQVIYLSDFKNTFYELEGNEGLDNRDQSQLYLTNKMLSSLNL